MNRWTGVCIACLLAAVASPLRSDEGNPTLDQFNKAKAAYDADVARLRTAVSNWFDKHAESVRSRGDKKAIDRVKAQRQTFKDKGILPPAAPPPLVQQSTAARQKMERAYQTAIKGFTRAKKDAEATAAEYQLNDFRLTAVGVTIAEWVRVRTPGRWRRNGDGHVFVFHDDNKVSEFGGDGTPITVGGWAIGPDGTGVVPLANNWKFSFTLLQDDTMSAPARDPRGRPVGPWVLKKVEK